VGVKNIECQSNGTLNVSQYNKILTQLCMTPFDIRLAKTQLAIIKDKVVWNWIWWPYLWGKLYLHLL